MKYRIELDFGKADPDFETMQEEIERIAGMVGEGFTSGEVFVSDNGVVYPGWWSILIELPPPDITIDTQ